MVWRMSETVDKFEDEVTALESQVLSDNPGDSRVELAHLRKQTIVAAIFLPLGFFTGLMGIKVGGMPGVESMVEVAQAIYSDVKVRGQVVPRFSPSTNPIPATVFQKTVTLDKP
jgi:hypothetical protein